MRSTTARNRILGSMTLAMVMSLFAALGLSMVTARFAPWREAERLLAGAVTFPAWWLCASLYVALGERRARRILVLSILTFILAASALLA